jgi:excisionase family DNA binding protein
MNEIITQVDGETRLLRATEVAQILNVSRAFAYRLMQQGKIRTVVIAKTHRVRPSDLMDFIEKSLVPGTHQMSGK